MTLMATDSLTRRFDDGTKADENESRLPDNARRLNLDQYLDLINLPRQVGLLTVICTLEASIVFVKL